MTGWNPPVAVFRIISPFGKLVTTDSGCAAAIIENFSEQSLCKRCQIGFIWQAKAVNAAEIQPVAACPVAVVINIRDPSAVIASEVTALPVDQPGRLCAIGPPLIGLYVGLIKICFSEWRISPTPLHTMHLIHPALILDANIAIVVDILIDKIL